MDRTNVKQGKETWLQPSGELQDKTRQDKTRYGNTGELRALFIHQLVLVCWKVVPQTISFYNPEPSYLEMPSLHCCMLQRCQVCTAACCNAARSALLHAATLPGLHCCMLQRCQVCTAACCNTARSALLHVAMLPGLHCCTFATLRHGSTTSPCFCVVGSRP
jgi:hypothetical protein